MARPAGLQAPGLPGPGRGACGAFMAYCGTSELLMTGSPPRFNPIFPFVGRHYPSGGTLSPPGSSSVCFGCLKTKWLRDFKVLAR